LIKNELDKVKNHFHNELKTVKLDIINMNGLNKNPVQDDIDYYENKLEMLNSEIKKFVFCFIFTFNFHL
jgi:hypothetical protein